MGGAKYSLSRVDLRLTCTAYREIRQKTQNIMKWDGRRWRSKGSSATETKSSYSQRQDRSILAGEGFGRLLYHSNRAQRRDGPIAGKNKWRTLSALNIKEVPAKLHHRQALHLLDNCG